jgi:hypothetical protein
MYYPGYTGGKFFTNCLALSKHAVVQDSFLAEADIILSENFSTANLIDYVSKKYNELAGSDWPLFDQLYQITPKHICYDEICSYSVRISKINKLWSIYKKLTPNSSYYDFKRELSCISLPRDQTLMKNWRDYEFGCGDFFGVDYTDKTEKEIRSTPHNNIINLCIERSKNFFLVAHDYSSSIQKLSVWKNATVIEFQNYIKFHDIAKTLKYGNRLTPLTHSYENSIKFDVDVNYFDETKFIGQIKGIYEILNYDDFNESNLRIFYKKYMELHKIKKDFSYEKL